MIWPIYLDNNATTALDPRVLAAMMPYLTNQFGNAASRSHLYGWQAADAVEIARNQVAELIGASAKEIVFTSGATEANNLAIKGICQKNTTNKNKILTLSTEHKAVLDTCLQLSHQGVDSLFLQPDQHGFLSIEALEKSISANTLLLSVMYANNEIGTIQDFKTIGQFCKQYGVILHTDATQAVGKIPINVQEENIDLLSMSAHKFYGPKGVGALFVSKKIGGLVAQLHGGQHERGMRSGTLNVPAIVGMGEACKIAQLEMQNENQRLTLLRDQLEKELLLLPNIKVNGMINSRLAHVSNLTFIDQDGEDLMTKLYKLAVSNGSACTSASVEPSHVLKSIGLSDNDAHASIRFSLGRFTSQQDIETAIAHIKEVLAG
jgi:cysteine desulfurase